MVGDIREKIHRQPLMYCIQYGGMHWRLKWYDGHTEAAKQTMFTKESKPVCENGAAMHVIDLLTNTFGSVIDQASTPVAYDPAIMWMLTGLACASSAGGIFFFFTFHHLTDKEEEMSALDVDEYGHAPPVEDSERK